MEEIKLNLKLEFQDLLNFQWFTLWKRLGKKAIIFFFVIIAIYTIPLFFMGITPRLNDFIAILTPLSFFAIGFLVLIFIIYFAAKKSYKYDSQIQKEHDYSINTTGINCSSESSYSNVRWGEIIKYSESKNAFYVYISLQKVFIFPKRLLNQNLIENIRLSLSKNISPNRKISSSVLPTWLRIAIYVIPFSIIIISNISNFGAIKDALATISNSNIDSKGEYENIQKCTLEIEKDNTNSIAYYNRGIAKLNLKNYQAAEYDFTLSIYFHKNFPEAYYSRGVTRLYLERNAEACEDFHVSSQLGFTQANKAVEQYCDKIQK